MSPVLFGLAAHLHSYRHWQSRLAATKLGSHERLRLQTVEREPTVDPPTALSASCPGTFPWAGEEKPSSLRVAQRARHPNARMCLVRWVLYIDRPVGINFCDGVAFLKRIYTVAFNLFNIRAALLIFVTHSSSLLYTQAHPNAAARNVKRSWPQGIMGNFKGPIRNSTIYYKDAFNRAYRDVVIICIL